MHRILECAQFLFDDPTFLSTCMLSMLLVVFAFIRAALYKPKCTLCHHYRHDHVYYAEMDHCWCLWDCNCTEFKAPKRRVSILFTMFSVMMLVGCTNESHSGFGLVSAFVMAVYSLLLIRLVVSLRNRAKAAEAELQQIDWALARREALDDCPDRVAKVLRLCRENARLCTANQILTEMLDKWRKGEPYTL